MNSNNSQIVNRLYNLSKCLLIEILIKSSKYYDLQYLITLTSDDIIKILLKMNLNELFNSFSKESTNFSMFVENGLNGIYITPRINNSKYDLLLCKSSNKLDDEIIYTCNNCNIALKQDNTIINRDKCDSKLNTHCRYEFAFMSERFMISKCIYCTTLKVFRDGILIDKVTETKEWYNTYNPEGRVCMNEVFNMKYKNKPRMPPTQLHNCILSNKKRLDIENSHIRLNDLINYDLDSNTISSGLIYYFLHACDYGYIEVVKSVLKVFVIKSDYDRYIYLSAYTRALDNNYKNIIKILNNHYENHYNLV